MRRLTILKPLINFLLFLTLSSCSELFLSDQNETEINDTIKESTGPIDYNSAENLAKFNTSHLTLPDTIFYLAELNKLKWSNEGEVNYSALDTLFSRGTPVDTTLYYVSTGGGGFRFGGKVRFAGYDQLKETNAINKALASYESEVSHGFSNENGAVKAFDLIHFLLNRGVNPNKQGVEELNLRMISMKSTYDKHPEYISNLIDLYKFYGFDMRNLDLSVSGGNSKLRQYLILEGARNYDMSTRIYDVGRLSVIRSVYKDRDTLKEQGVVLDFSGIDGDFFPFEKDTLGLQMMLELGLSPDHLTPKGQRLRDDFGHFVNELMNRIVDEYVAQQTDLE